MIGGQYVPGIPAESVVDELLNVGVAPRGDARP
jgi:hypothetical protein